MQQQSVFCTITGEHVIKEKLHRYLSPSSGEFSQMHACEKRTSSFYLDLISCRILSMSTLSIALSTYLSNFILCNFIPLLHHISEANIVLFPPQHLSDHLSSWPFFFSIFFRFSGNLKLQIWQFWTWISLITSKRKCFFVVWEHSPTTQTKII